MSDGIVLRAEGLHCSYGSGEAVIEVIRGASIEVSRGEVVAITGPSGSGKSTLLHSLGLLERPVKGTVTICGNDGWNVGTGRRSILRNRHIGFVFQFHHLLEEFTLLENAAMPCLISGMKHAESMERAHGLLERVGLSHRTGHFPSRVSGGERQRAALARALAMSPDIVLADEPTGNLDDGNSREVEALIMELAAEQKRAFLMATHSEELASAVHRRLHLESGALRQSPGTGRHELY